MDGELIRKVYLASIKNDGWRYRVYKLFEQELDRTLPNRREIQEGVRSYLYECKELKLPKLYLTLLEKCRDNAIIRDRTI